MNGMICSRCKKNKAVIFVTKMENGEMKNEGFCLKCAKELGLKPVEDILSNLGIKDTDIDTICSQANEFMGGDIQNVDDNADNFGETGTGSFLRHFFGNLAIPNKPNEKKAEMRQRPGNDRPAKKYLSAFCTCLNDKAKNGEVDTLIGREEEVLHTLQILNRRLKNNPCLIGEPGVGKTAIVEGIATAIACGKAPSKLLGKEIWQLDMTALVAGTQYRGQMEGRMKGLLDEVRALGNIILFIDEVHSIVGAGDAEGSMNAANIIKPALSRGEVQVIGATTFAEYRKHIEKDAALERRFQPVIVEEPSVQATVEIIKGIKGYYESFHHVEIPDEVALEAVSLSERYITDRFLPDKSIDLIDEACAKINLHDPSCAKMDRLCAESKALREKAENLAKGPVSPDNEKELSCIQAQSAAVKAKIDSLYSSLPTLTPNDIAQVIELWTGIPSGKITTSEASSLKKLELALKKRIIGQDTAIDSLCRAIRRRRAGIGVSKKPVSFLFTGPTGVGKTEIVKQLAAHLFDGPDSLIRLDMSEYMEKHAVSRLIGSPPGYIGYDAAGQLTEKVRRRPYCVILFDEIEKAHPDIMNVLLQILDEGRITDAQGRRVDFSNAVIVLTTNAGSNEKNSVISGFGTKTFIADREKTIRALKDFLRPEFLNRLDEIITFNRLDMDAISRIAKVLLNELKESLSEKGISFHFTDGVCAYIANGSFSDEYGARNVKRFIETNIEDAIAEAVTDGQTVHEVRLQMQANNKLKVRIL